MYRLPWLLCAICLAGCDVNQLGPPPVAGARQDREVRWEEDFNKNRPFEPHGPPPSGSAAQNENLLQSFLMSIANEVGPDEIVGILEQHLRGKERRGQGQERSYQVLAAMALIRRDTDTQEALQVLIEALGGEDEWVARITAQMLPRLSPASFPALPALAKASNRADQAAQSAALGAADFGLPAVPPLIDALCDQDPSKRVSDLWTSHGLAEIGPLAVPALVEALANEHENVRFGACFALGRIGLRSTAAEPALIPLLSDPVPCVRSAAAESLQRMNCHTTAVVSALLATVHDSDERARGAFVEALGVLGREDPRVSPVLFELTRDSVPKVRRTAVHALGELGEIAQDVWPQLHEAFQSADPQERYGYAEALLRMDQDAAARAGITMQSLSGMPIRHSAPGE